MPTPRKGESQKDFVKRAIPILKKEGLSQRQAIGKAEGMYTYYKNKGKKKMKESVLPTTFGEYFTEGKRRDTAVFNFGKFNIPTVGHKLLMDTILSIAENNNADAYLFASQKIERDPLQTPLTFKEKVRMLSEIAPAGLTVVSEAGDKTNTMFAAVNYLGRKKYKKIIMVVGSDRMDGADAVPQESLKAELAKVNPEAVLEFAQAGKKRKSKGEGVQAASSSAARDAFRNKDKVKFASIVPKQIAKQMWNIMRSKVKKSK